MKHWVFDLDGTLVDSFQHYFDSLDEIFRDHGKIFSSDLKMPALTELLVHFFRDHLGEDAVAPALEKLQHQSNERAKAIRAFHGMHELLLTLKANGSKVAVWTNRDYTSAELILKHSGIQAHLDAFVSGTCTPRRKPYPDGLIKVMESLGCAPHEITMVGDHEHDVMAAKEVGARAIRASWHSYWQMEPCPHADYQFHSLDEFSRWILR